jgi:UDP-glucose 4-epimerase
MSMPEMPRDLENVRVLVTGGAGFVGSQLTRALLARGATVTVLDDLFTGKREDLPVDSRLEFVHGCVTDPALVRRLVAVSDLIFHLAARNILASMEDAKADFLVNAGGTLNLLQAIQASGQSISRVVYTSSASVYGNPKHLPISEDDGTTCLSPYAASKLSGELYCRVFYEQYGLPLATVRYSNVYGIGQSPLNPYCGVISKFFVAAERGDELVVHGDGLQTRDYTYVDDAVAATIRAALTTKADGEIFNIGTGLETSVLDLVAALNRLYGGGLVVRHSERRDIDNVRRRVMNIERSRSRLRWTPEVTLDEGLRRTQAWIRTIPVSWMRELGSE